MEASSDILAMTDPVPILFSQVSQTQVYWDFWIVAATAVIGILFTVKLDLLRGPTIGALFVLWLFFAASNHNGLQSNLERRVALTEWSLSSSNAREVCRSANHHSVAVSAVCEALPGENLIMWQKIVSATVAVAIIGIPLLRRKLERTTAGA